MDDFYITVVSDASGQTFPNNLITDFRNILSHPIELQAPYEVALVDCTYVHSKAIVLKGELMMHGIFHHEKENNYPYHTTRDITNIQDIVEELNTIPAPYNYWTYFIAEKGNIDSKEKINHKKPFKLKRWECIPEICNLAKNSAYTGILNRTQLFLYCNLIESQRKASSMVPLLRNFEYKGDHNSVVYHEFEHRYYFPVKVNRIEEIHCYIRHENGEAPSLNIQPFTATLHFKKRL